MKQELQNSFVYAKKGFLLVELLLAMSILMTVLVPFSLYQIQTYTLYKNARKRHQVLHLVDTVFETMRYCGTLPSSPVIEDGVTVTSKQVFSHAEYFQDDDSSIFVELQAVWKGASGLQEKASFISLVLMPSLHKVTA